MKCYTKLLCIYLPIFDGDCPFAKRCANFIPSSGLKGEADEVRVGSNPLVRAKRSESAPKERASRNRAIRDERSGVPNKQGDLRLPGKENHEERK